MTEQQQALGSSCNGQSDTVCVGAAFGAVCDGTGHCRRDPDYPGACDCVVPAPSTPPTPCHCSDGTPAGQQCGTGGTCHPVLTGQIFYCSC